MLSDNGVEVHITFRCGENAVEVLDAAGICKAQDGSVKENLASSIRLEHESFYQRFPPVRIRGNPTMQSETSFIVRYAETDRTGLVQHSNYAVWFQTG